MIGGINAFRAPAPIYPVPVPVVDADPSVDLIFCGFNKAWLPYILGSLASLKMQSTWDTTDEDVMAITLQRVDSLIYQVSLAAEIAFVCEEFNTTCAVTYPRVGTGPGLIRVADVVEFSATFDTTSGRWEIEPYFGCCVSYTPLYTSLNALLIPVGNSVLCEGGSVALDDYMQVVSRANITGYGSSVPGVLGVYIDSIT